MPCLLQAVAEVGVGATGSLAGSTASRRCGERTDRRSTRNDHNCLSHGHLRGVETQPRLAPVKLARAASAPIGASGFVQPRRLAEVALQELVGRIFGGHSLSFALAQFHPADLA